MAVCLQMVVRWPRRMLCSRECVVWWMLCHLWLLRVWRMLCRFPLLWRMLYRRGRAIRSMLRHHLVLRACSPLALLATVFCAGPALWVAFVWVACLECPPPPCFFCCPLVVLVATAVLCVCLYFFFSVSLSLVLCALVLACLAAINLCL